MRRQFTILFASLGLLACGDASLIDMIDDTPAPSQQQADSSVDATQTPSEQPGDSSVPADIVLDGGAAGEGGTKVDADVAPDASGDSGAFTRDDMEQRICREGLEKLETFLSTRRACERHEDCAIIGGCSGSIGFAAVRADAREEAQRMAEGICRYNDGPLYDATCEQNRCVKRKTAEWCGGPPSRGSCGDGQALYPLRCNGSTTEESCAAHCDGPDDAGCPTGFSCQQTSVFDQGCAASPSSLFLCKPTPACEVALGLDTDGAPYVKRGTKSFISDTRGESIELWAENLTGQRKTLRYRPPCPAPARLTGLGTYDAFGTCLAGACPDPTFREVVLEPGARISLGTAQVSAAPSACGPGLGRGEYEIGLELPELSGAVTCGPEAFQLVVR